MLNTNLVSDEYRELIADLHDRRPNFGTGSCIRYEDIAKYAKYCNAVSMLDYGCGKGALIKRLKKDQKNGVMMVCEKIKGYDPAIKKFTTLKENEKFDMVVSFDVMEHIEPELIDNVMCHIRDITKKIGIFSISCNPAKKHLRDGRNAHLLIQPPEWWIEKFIEYGWDVIEKEIYESEFKREKDKSKGISKDISMKIIDLYIVVEKKI
jgi:SAM-dependent methyltransferase